MNINSIVLIALALLTLFLALGLACEGGEIDTEKVEKTVQEALADDTTSEREEQAAQDAMASEPGDSAQSTQSTEETSQPTTTLSPAGSPPLGRIRLPHPPTALPQGPRQPHSPQTRLYKPKPPSPSQTATPSATLVDDLEYWPHNVQFEWPSDALVHQAAFSGSPSEVEALLERGFSVRRDDLATLSLGLLAELRYRIDVDHVHRCLVDRISAQQGPVNALAFLPSTYQPVINRRFPLLNLPSEHVGIEIG